MHAPVVAYPVGLWMWVETAKSLFFHHHYHYRDIYFLLFNNNDEFICLHLASPSEFAIKILTPLHVDLYRLREANNHIARIIKPVEND